MVKQSMVVDCPGCGNHSLVNTMETLDIPYFPDILSTILTCDRCGFRHVDFINPKINKPLRHTLRISSQEDLSIRVIRSTSATIRVPELGAIIEPGPASQGFVSNTEGVLQRIRDIIETAKREAEDDDVRMRADGLIEKIDRVVFGDESATLVIEDPFGNSAIISKKVEEEELTEEEVSHMKVGMIMVDMLDPEAEEE